MTRAQLEGPRKIYVVLPYIDKAELISTRQSVGTTHEDESSTLIEVLEGHRT